MAKARRVEISTVYAGKNISGQINRFMKSFTYDDVASGASDSVSISLRDDEKLWMGAWYPGKGDRMTSSVAFINWYKDDSRRVLHCGSFQVDDLSFNGRPNTGAIKAVSVPQSSSFNAEERTKTWESVTVAQIAEEIAKRAGIELYYEAESISIKSIEQDAQTDCKFLYSLCQAYGLAMKVYANKIVIFDEEKYEKKAAMLTIRESDMESWSYDTTIAGTYTGATFAFTDPNDEQEYAIDIGGGDRILTINVTADSIHDAELKGIAKLNNENKKDTTMSVTIMANPAIVAGITVQIAELGKLNGKYYVDKVHTNVAGGSKSTMTLTLHRVTARIKNASVRAVEAIKEEKKAEGTQYTIVSGDTLWGIARRFLGKGVRYVEIYNLNKDVIEAAAKAHGKSSSSNGHWIWPGTVLTIPAA